MPGVNAFGTQLLRGDGADPETFAAVANVTTIGGPELSREVIDVTSHDSQDAYQEFVGGLKNGGEVSLEINYDPRVHDSLAADLDDSEPRTYRIVWPVTPAATWEFKAVMTQFSPEAAHDDKLTAEVTFQVSGKPNLSAA